MNPANQEITAEGVPPQYPPNWSLKKKATPTHLRPQKFNSTSSLFIDSTISSPRNLELLRSIAEELRSLIEDPISSPQSEEERKQFEIFDELKHPITNSHLDFKKIPDVIVVEDFLKKVFKIGQLAAESLIMSVAYLYRIRESCNGMPRLFPYNYRRFILSCLILASKVWEEQAVWNVDFLDIFPLATPYDLVQLEKKILSLLHFDVTLNRQEYAKIYFDLRAKSKTTEEHFHELKPLDMEGGNLLELRTKNFVIDNHELIPRGSITRSSGSVDDFTKLQKSPRVVLN